MSGQEITLLTTAADRANLPPENGVNMGQKAMDGLHPNRRTDEQPDAIRFETGDWVANGARGKGLCSAASPRRSLEHASDYAISGATVVAISRLSSDNIVSFPGQIERLRHDDGIVAGEITSPELTNARCIAMPAEGMSGRHSVSAR